MIFCPLRTSEQSWEDQLVDKQPGPVSNSDEKIHCTAEDHSRPKVILANQGSRIQGPVKGWRKTPTLNIPNLNSILTVFVCNLEYGPHFKQTRPDDLKPKEADTRVRRWEGMG